MASLILALKAGPPRILKPYLWFQLLHIPLLWGADWLWGTWNPIYAVVYSGFTLAILLAILGVVWDCLRTRQYRARISVSALLLALCLGKLASSGVSGLGWISLVEGVILIWAGMLVAFLAPYTANWRIALTLGLFWLSQALYDFGWVLHGHYWDSINWIVPPISGIVAFSLIALLSQHPRYLPDCSA